MLHHPRPQPPVSPLLSEEQLGCWTAELSPVSPVSPMDDSSPTKSQVAPKTTARWIPGAVPPTYTGPLPPNMIQHGHAPEFDEGDKKRCPFCASGIPIGHLMTQQLATACSLVNLRETIDQTLMVYEPGQAKVGGKGAPVKIAALRVPIEDAQVSVLEDLLRDEATSAEREAAAKEKEKRVSSLRLLVTLIEPND